MEINSVPKIPKNTILYLCERCNIKTSNKKDYNKHLMTAKHLKKVDGNIKIEKNPQNNSCDCGKKYKNYSGLWKHKKKCINTFLPTSINETIIDSSNNEIKVLTTLVLELVKNNTELQKQNQDFQKQVLDVCQNIQPSTILK
jgi:hypothetical protein